MIIELAMAIYVVGVVVTAVGFGMAGRSLLDRNGPLPLFWPLMVVGGVSLGALYVVYWLSILAPHRFGAYLRSKHRG